MPYEFKRYNCIKCHTQHITFQEALNCEFLPELKVPGSDHIEGDIISWEDEESGLGVRFSYSGQSGIILKKLLNLHSNGTHHEVTFIVGKTYMGKVICEKRILWSQEHGWFAPAEWSYKIGTYHKFYGPDIIPPNVSN